MVLSTLGVAADVTPSVIETFFSHYINRKPLRQKPTAHISYHEGLRLIRKFLAYASQHSVEDVQAFTGQWVPCPTWVSMDEMLIPDQFIAKSASLIQSQLGPHGLEQVGGKEWWQWRRPEIPFKAEWIEMKSDLAERKAQGKGKSERIILYVHGGAYYFGSTGEHRYQMQRHARKLKAQLLAPKYRLAPQFPFPCGLHDCIAAYLYLIETHAPNTILLGGDSAGGGMVVSMLVTLRDQGIPLPAGAVLLSPWVDLTHSFPSVAGGGEFDYIPANGFHHKPSMAWPPPNAADLASLEKGSGVAAKSTVAQKNGAQTDQISGDAADTEAARGFSVHEADASAVHDPNDPDVRRANSVPKAGQNLSIQLDGKLIEIQDQIQMYTANHLLAHPLVSPVMQPSLGGLPPMLIQVGGGELLRDEQIYLAHKAASPSSYPPPDAALDEHDPERRFLNKYGPTDVQLQVWDDLCHVPHTLSFTRPAKFMYRSVAQFGAWALAHAQSRPMTIMDDDDISVISSDASSDKSIKEVQSAADATSVGSSNVQSNLDGQPGESSVRNVRMRAHTISTASGAVGKAGDPLPPFDDHMIRQRVDRHGMTFPLPPPAEIPSLHLDPSTIGKIKPGPVRKWIAKKSDWDTRFAKEKRNVQKNRLKELKQGYDGFPGETPPPTALAGRRFKSMEKEKQRKGKSWGLAMWSGWGSKHDETTIERKKRLHRRPTQSVILPEAGKGIAAAEDPQKIIEKVEPRQRDPVIATNEAVPSKSSDGHPTEATDTHTAEIAAAAAGAGVGAAVAATVFSKQESHKVEGSENTYLSANNARPHNGTIAYPFKLRNMPAASASTATLDSSVDQVRPMSGIAMTGGTRPATARTESNLGNEEGSGEIGGRVDGADDGEIGGHDWVVGGTKETKAQSAKEEQDKSLDDHSASNGLAAGGVIAGGAAVAGHAAHEHHKDAPASSPDNHVEDGGNEIGGHNWIVGTNKSSQSEQEEQRPAQGPQHDSATNGTSAMLAVMQSPTAAPVHNENKEEGTKGGSEIGGHDWIVSGSDKGKQAEDSSSTNNVSNDSVAGSGPQAGKETLGAEDGKNVQRPQLQTFVTARESL